MQVTLKQEGKTLRSIQHESNQYIEAPKSGRFTINLYNNYPSRRLAVVTLDGRNVIDGKEGSFDGRGWLLEPWGRIEIQGWRRGDDKAAAFEFTSQEESYVAKIGDGTSNVGFIGVAVFDEKVEPKVKAPPVTIPTPTYPTYPTYPIYPPGPVWISDKHYTGDYPFEGTTCNTASDAISARRGDTRRRVVRTTGIKDVGTAYGSEVDFHTKTVEFNRESSPSKVISIRYATTERLKSWGVPVDKPDSKLGSGSAFPGEGVPAPPGWTA